MRKKVFRCHLNADFEGCYQRDSYKWNCLKFEQPLEIIASYLAPMGSMERNFSQFYNDLDLHAVTLTNSSQFLSLKYFQESEWAKNQDRGHRPAPITSKVSDDLPKMSNQPFWGCQQSLWLLPNAYATAQIEKYYESHQHFRALESFAQWKFSTFSESLRSCLLMTHSLIFQAPRRTPKFARNLLFSWGFLSAVIHLSNEKVFLIKFSKKKFFHKNIYYKNKINMGWTFQFIF